MAPRLALALCPPARQATVCATPPPCPCSSGRQPADLALRELKHLHGLLHQALVIALLQQPVAGAEVAEKLVRNRAKKEGGKRKGRAADGVELAAEDLIKA